ncbi:MAG: V-type ATPase subunit [Bulleidia sp.]
MSSDLAMTVKARAMFGKRLKEDDYEALIQKRDVGDIAAHLKNETQYREILSGINERAIHRQHLESLLRKDIFLRLKKLMRYSDEKDRDFIYTFSMKSEIMMILFCVRYIMNPDQNIRDEMIASMPVFTEKYFSFDVKKLIEINAYDELINLLQGTAYQPILMKYRSEKIQELDYIALEHDMEILIFRKIHLAIDRYGNSEDAQKMREIINGRAELINLSVIYRLKREFHMTGDTMEALLLPYHSMFSEKEIHEMIENSSAQEVLDAIRKKYRRYVKDAVFTNIEHYVEQISFHLYHYFMEYETEPSLILMSYMYLADTEIHNIINIIEGVRYKVSPDRIRAMLTY